MNDAARQLYRVAPRQVNQTLAAALRHWLPETPTWGQVRRLVQSRRVLVNGNLCQDQGRRLKLTDVVSVLPHSTAPVAREDDVRIRYVDTQVVVVEKPSGLTSVRHTDERSWSAKRKRQNPTLEDLLPRILAKRENRGGGKTRQRPSRLPPRTRTPPVRPVHRLDRDTSGLMIFARTVPAERELGLQFRKHSTGRHYLAIVAGAVRAQTITTNLVRDRGDGRRGSTTDPKQGKRAVTHVRPIETIAGYTMVECTLETGRTHQIRIHLSELGHPVCGDKVYAAPDDAADSSRAPRLALHAAALSFTHPSSGKRMDFQMPLPSDLDEFWNRLRRGK